MWDAVRTGVAGGAALLVVGEREMTVKSGLAKNSYVDSTHFTVTCALVTSDGGRDNRTC